MTSKRSDRRQLWLTPQAGSTAAGATVEVAVCRPTFTRYSYAVPAELADQVRVGAAVQAPYGRGGRIIAGYVTAVHVAETQHTLRPLAGMTSGAEVLTPELVQLGEWVSEYYVHAPGLVLDGLAPSAVRQGPPRPRRVIRIATLDPERKTTAAQARVLEALQGGALEAGQLMQLSGGSAGLLRRMLKAGTLSVELAPASPLSISAGAAPPPCPEDEFSLTAGQQTALAAIEKHAVTQRAFRVMLLFGVPGSGKTEVYVRAIRAVVAAGRQALLIVPEIALVTQLIERLARRFSQAAILHGQLPARVRRQAWLDIRSGAARVVIGTRSAVFAPFAELGLIIVDEEQESSFKNLAAPFYHARDVAIKRGQLANVPVVLGSATPSLESWHNAHTLPHYQLLELPQRVPGAELPRARVVTPSDLEGERQAVLSAEMVAALQARLEAGEQAVLLQNRRGYAPVLSCERCRLTLRCPRCGFHVVLHRVTDEVRCHHCGWRGPVPATCSDSTCGGAWQLVGPGIQRVEEELRRRWPAARVLRLDADTMRRPADYRTALGAFERGEADFLIGTQMVAKGLDFPRVTLVGVLDADALLSQPDFRAAERTFQLLLQTIGRAGRAGGAAEALVQATQPDQPVLACAARLDYPSFAAEELELRKALADPPFMRLCRVVLSDATVARLRSAAQGLASALQERAGRVHAGLRIDPAAPCLMPRIKHLHRWQVVIRAPRPGLAQQLVALLRSEKRWPPTVARLRIDVDALDFS